MVLWGAMESYHAFKTMQGIQEAQYKLNSEYPEAQAFMASEEEEKNIRGRWTDSLTADAIGAAQYERQLAWRPFEEQYAGSLDSVPGLRKSIEEKLGMSRYLDDADKQKLREEVHLSDEQEAAISKARALYEKQKAEAIRLALEGDVDYGAGALTWQAADVAANLGLSFAPFISSVLFEGWEETPWWVPEA